MRGVLVAAVCLSAVVSVGANCGGLWAQLMGAYGGSGGVLVPNPRRVAKEGARKQQWGAPPGAMRTPHPPYPPRPPLRPPPRPRRSTAHTCSGAAPLTAVLIEPRRLAATLVALRSVARHAPEGTCFIWYALPETRIWALQHELVQTLRGRIEFRGIPAYAQASKNPERVDAPTMFTRYDYWQSLPTELVLSFQSDSIFCTPFDVGRFAQYAQVGAPWRDSFGHCKSRARSFNVMVANVSQEESMQRGWVSHSEEWCPERGTIGNSGLSLRNRSWMMRAIATCPIASELKSGLPTVPPGPGQCRCVPTQNSLHCREDYYFASVLTGLGAPMPTRAEAAAFSVETSAPPPGIMPMGGRKCL